MVTNTESSRIRKKIRIATKIKKKSTAALNPSNKRHQNPFVLFLSHPGYKETDLSHSRFGGGTNTDSHAYYAAVLIALHVLAVRLSVCPSVPVVRAPKWKRKCIERPRLVQTFSPGQE